MQTTPKITINQPPHGIASCWCQTAAKGQKHASSKNPDARRHPDALDRPHACCPGVSRRPDRAAAMTSWPDSARATSRIKKNPIPTGLEPATSTCACTSRVALYRLGYGRRRSRDRRIHTLTPLRPSAAGRAHGIAAERPAKQANQTHPPERSRKALVQQQLGRAAGLQASACLVASPRAIKRPACSIAR